MKKFSFHYTIFITYPRSFPSRSHFTEEEYKISLFTFPPKFPSSLIRDTTSTERLALIAAV